MNWRNRVYDLLNPQHRGGSLSRLVNIVLIVLIIINVVAISLETVPKIKQAYAIELFFLEVFSVVVFSLEYLLRLWSVPENKIPQARSRYLFSFDSVVDLLAVFPLYISLFFGIDLKALLALRLFRLLKLIRYFAPLAVLLNVLRAEARSFVAAVMILLILIFVSASGIYFFEREVQPEVFGSIPLALWWSTVTLTTLGYGDVVPVTVFGKIFAGMMTIFSIGIVALPAGMLASRFSDELLKRKQHYSDTVKALVSDGELSAEDHESLEHVRTELCLSKQDAELIQDASNNIAPCPACGGSGEITNPNSKG